MDMAKDKNTSLTEGVIWKKLLFFVFPMFLGNLFQQLYNTVDALIVGWFLDKSALAAVTSSGSLIFMLVGFFNGIAMGAGVVIAKHFGAKDHQSLRQVIHTNVAFGLTVGVLLTLLGVTLTPTILRWMGTPENVLPNSIAYFRVYFFGAVFVVMYNISVGILQAVGDSRHPLYYLIISSLTNVALDLLFVGGLGWGVWSAALATTISQALSASLCMYRLIRKREVYQVQLRKVRFHGKSLKDIVHYGLPSGVQNSIIGLANVVVQANINFFGDAAMAGCGSYSKIEGFAFLPISCFAMGMSTFVSQNLGARQYDRVKQGVRIGIFCSVLLAETVGVLFYLFAPHLISLFNSAPEVIDFGVRQAKLESLFYCVLAFSHCMAGILRGSGKAIVPMLVMLFSWCVIRITYITIVIGLVPKIEVVFSAYPITWSISSVIFLVYFLRADWLHGFDKLSSYHPQSEKS